MTVGVITVPPDAPLREVAALLLGAKVSGLPVVDEGRVVGIVSESDLLPVGEVPVRRVATVADVMTRTLVSLVEGMSVSEAARVLQRHRIKRAPVLRGDRLVGIVTRSDLLRPFLRTDTEILAEVEESVVAEALSLSPRQVRVSVEDGVVTLTGVVDDPRARALMRHLTRAVDGVVDVVDELVEPVSGQSVA